MNRKPINNKKDFFLGDDPIERILFIIIYGVNTGLLAVAIYILYLFIIKRR